MGLDLSSKVNIAGIFLFFCLLGCIELNEKLSTGLGLKKNTVLLEGFSEKRKLFKSVQISL